MALSGSYVVKATSQNNLIFSWAAAQDIGANESRISWQLLLAAGQFGRIDAGPGSPWSATVAGKPFSGRADLSIGNNETKVLAAGQVTVAHSADGTAGFAFSFTQEFWIQFGSEYISTVSGSGSATLDTIARASVPTAGAAATMGEALVIATNRASAAFTHTLTYRFGSASGTIGENVGDSVSWTPSLELARQIPNGTSGTAVISCVTYLDGKAIGTKEVTVVLTVPASIVPKAAATWEDTSGAFSKVGALVQNISKLRWDVAGTGSYGSTIVSAAVTLKGKAYSGGILTDAGAIPVKIAVTDSRGRVGIAEDTLTVAAYAPPSLTLSASRCLEDGTADEAGDHAKVTVSGFVTQVNGQNAAELQVSWGGGAETVLPEVGAIAWERIVPADPDTTAQISATLSDKLASTAKSMVLSTGYATLDLLAGGKGIAFGKAATKEGFECAMPAFFTGPVSGVAPDGYGLGKSGGKWPSDLNDAAECGFYNFGSSTLNRPSYMSEGVVIVASRGANWLVQIACSTYDYTSGSGILAVRRCTGAGNWSKWECINPPMIPGIEYRTTKRHNGKPVYALFRSWGAMPNKGTVEYDISWLNIRDIVSFHAYMENGGDCYHLPFNTYRAEARNSKIYKHSPDSDASMYTCYATLEYTKTTD